MTPASVSRKRRLLVIASTYPRWSGDPEPGFVHELARRLTDCFDVTVLGPHAPGAAFNEMLDGVRVVRYRYAPARLETLVNDGGIISNLQRKPWKWLLVPGFLVALAWRTWRLVRTVRPDVIHVHWLLPQGLVIALIGLIDSRVPPFVVTSHGADLFALRAPPLQAAKRFVARRATAITVVSTPMRDDLTRLGVTPCKISVQPMGVDLTRRFTPDYTVERSHNEILFVGRLVEKKGLRHLIDAMPAVLQSYPSAFLTVAGFGPEEAERRAQVKHLRLQDKVNFVGAISQPELPDLYRRAAVFVAPFVQAASGDQEGLGLVSVEAAGCGCPVVISDVPAVRQVFSEADMATLAKPGDATTLALAIIQALESSKKLTAVRTNAQNATVMSFDWTVVAKRYSDLLCALVTSS